MILVVAIFVVRRIGMTNPSVKLGVGKKFLEKRKEPPSSKMKLVWQPQHFNIGGSMSMNGVKSLSHSKWRCKYHIVFAPKYRRQIIYGRIKASGRPDASFFNQKLITIIYYIIYNSAILITGVIDVS